MDFLSTEPTSHWTRGKEAINTIPGQYDIHKTIENKREDKRELKQSRKINKNTRQPRPTAHSMQTFIVSAFLNRWKQDIRLIRKTTQRPNAWQVKSYLRWRVYRQSRQDTQRQRKRRYPQPIDMHIKWQVAARSIVIIGAIPESRIFFPVFHFCFP